jgi:hypothetical protein
VVYQFAKSTYLQCLYVRANGDILIGTIFPNASIYYITGTTTEIPRVTRIYTFIGIPGTTGIVETEPDMFTFSAASSKASASKSTAPEESSSLIYSGPLSQTYEKSNTSPTAAFSAQSSASPRTRPSS